MLVEWLMMRRDIFPFLIVAWIVLCVGGFFLFYINRNAQFKRKYFPWYAIIAGSLFLSMALEMGNPLLSLVVMGPITAIITFINIKTTKCCANCGGTIVNQMRFTKSEYCPKCGGKLNT